MQSHGSPSNLQLPIKPEWCEIRLLVTACISLSAPFWTAISFLGSSLRFHSIDNLFAVFYSPIEYIGEGSTNQLSYF